jgi:hypothetical protein
MHLDTGSWRYVPEVDAVGEVSFETGPLLAFVLVNRMLARLQELSWEPPAREAIGQATTASRSSSIRPNSSGSRPPATHPMTTTDGL